MKSVLFSAAVLAVIGSIYACSDEHTHNVPTDSEGGHTSPYPSCNAITQACHQYDVGEGDIHECHEIGHDATSDEACAPQKDRCLALCAAAGGDGGGNGDGGGHGEAGHD